MAPHTKKRSTPARRRRFTEAELTAALRQILPQVSKEMEAGWERLRGRIQQKGLPDPGPLKPGELFFDRPERRRPRRRSTA